MEEPQSLLYNWSLKAAIAARLGDVLERVGEVTSECLLFGYFLQLFVKMVYEKYGRYEE